MKKLFYTAAVLLSCQIAQAKDRDAKALRGLGTEIPKLESGFYGKWAFDKLDYHPYAISGLSPSEEKVVSKFAFDIQTNKVMLNGKECQNPKYYKAKADTSSYYYFTAEEKRRPYLPFLKSFFTKTCPKKNGQPFTIEEFKNAAETREITILCDNQKDFFNSPYGIILLDENTVFSQSAGGYFCMRKKG